MRKREFLLMAVVLALAIAAPAAAAPSFWGGFLLNGSFAWPTGGTGAQSKNGSNANSGGFQYANTDGGGTGWGVVLQAEGAAGFQDSDEDSQEQGMIAGMGQTVSAADGGSATGLQVGGAGQTQANDCGTQSQYVGGVQYAYVSTGEGGSAVATQSATVVVYQSQECAETPDDEVVPEE